MFQDVRGRRQHRVQVGTAAEQPEGDAAVPLAPPELLQPALHAHHLQDAPPQVSSRRGSSGGGGLGRPRGARGSRPDSSSLSSWVRRVVQGGVATVRERRVKEHGRKEVPRMSETLLPNCGKPTPNLPNPSRGAETLSAAWIKLTRQPVTATELYEY